MGSRSLSCVIAIAVNLTAATAFGWGPHSEIAQAALDAMGPNDALVRLLGPDAKRLAQYVWMADWRNQLLERGDEVFYANDVLLFPAAPKHTQHICPEVEQTYAPFFRRALQALRTESPRNAARWIGSLLHFTTDTGSPPHALGILGPLHSKMENWLDPKLIHIPDYQPQLLGLDDASAEAGFLARMQGLIAFSKERAERCRGDVEADRRSAVEPVVLESALETARVTADLLHTLGVLGARDGGQTELSGKASAPQLSEPSLSRLPVKVMLLGTLFSTLTEPDGTFTFHNLPAGVYQSVLSAPGQVLQLQSVTLHAGGSVNLVPVNLPAPSSGNLVRNANFALRWVSPTGFDHWSERNPPGGLGGTHPVTDWDGEWIPLRTGRTYELSVEWKPATADPDASVFLRTKAKLDASAMPVESAPVLPGGKAITITGSPEAAWAHTILRTRQAPTAVIGQISLRQVN